MFLCPQLLNVGLAATLLSVCVLVPVGTFAASPIERREVLRYSTVNYSCPAFEEDQASVTLSSNGSNQIFFFHEGLQLCLQSGFNTTLTICKVDSNFTGTIACYAGSCDVGTDSIEGVQGLLGRLALKVSCKHSRCVQRCYFVIVVKASLLTHCVLHL